MEQKIVDRRDDLLRDPVKAVVERTRFLNSASRPEFSRAWLLRALGAELHRYSMEDDYIDMSSAPVHAAAEALTALEKSADWIHPKLVEYLLACRDIAMMAALPLGTDETKFESGGREWPLLSNVAISGTPFKVSNTTAHSVPIIENNLANPLYCEGVVSGFVEKVDILKRECGVTHLVFIEKEIGPVGAISMMASLVKGSGLPACIYRETHWAQRAAIAGEMPTAESRVAILYDLIVSGTGICNAADVVKEISGARSLAAVVLCGYGLRRNELKTEQGQRIRVEALTWREDEGTARTDTAARGKSEARNNSVSREKPREVKTLERSSDKTAVLVPPGSYTVETLPPMSANAKSIVERVRAKANQYKSASSHISEKTPSGVPSRGLRLSDEKGLGIRLK